MTSVRYLSPRIAFVALIATTSILVPLAGSADPVTTPGAAAAAPKPDTPKPDVAAAPAAPSRDDMRARMTADREAFFSARLAALQAGLQLTPVQQGLWPPVESAIRDLAALRRAHGRHGEGDPSRKAGSSIDQLTERGERLVQTGGALKKLASATGPLLASLTPEQKERLPMLLRGVRPGRVMARAFELQDDSMDHDGGDRMRHGDMRRDDMDDMDDMDHGEMRHGMMDRRGMGRGDMEREDGPERRSADRDERGYGSFDGREQDSGPRRHHHHHRDDDDGDDMFSRG